MPVRVSLLQVSLAIASVIVAGSTAAVGPSERSPGPDPAAALHLASGEQAALSAAEIAMASEFDPERAVLEMRETTGATLVARLTPQLLPSAPPHGGRVIVLRAGERRLIRLGTMFNEEDLAGSIVLVEVLEGDGQLVARLVGAAGENDASDASAVVSSAGGPVAALATTPKMTRRRLEGRVLTSTDLIDSAETSQELDHETAVIYRVYAIFGDARLPVAYRGSDGAAFESLYLATVAGEWDTYSPATQETLQPFLIPPAYTRSWAAPAGAQANGGVRTADSETNYCGLLSHFWGWVENPDGKVRVWYQTSAPGDAGRALSLATSADTIIWPDIAGFMAPHAPLSDGEMWCNGGSGRLDIYLSDIGRSTTTPRTGINTKCKETPAYIRLNRSEGASVLAHEIFHASQFSFPLTKCLTSDAYNWWTEGSAQWVMDKVFPILNREQDVAVHLIGRPEVSLDVNTDPHRYSSYLLPFYLYRKSGDAAFVRRIWEACQGPDAVNAFQAAVAEGWEGVWPRFALHNWNTEPVDTYRDWDRLDEAPVKADLPTAVALGGASEKEYEISFDLPKLSTRYEHYVFTDAATRSVRFWNGATFDLQKTTLPVVQTVWDPRPATAAAKEGVRVQALVKIKGHNWQAPADWTDNPAFTFCRDVAAERIEELVLIISNSQFLDPGKRAKHPGEPPLLHVSKVGCYKWTGTSTAVSTGDGTVLSVAANPLTWERVATAPTDPDPTVAYAATGVIAAAMAGACSGAGVFAISPALTMMWTANYTPLESASKRGHVFGAVSVDTFPLTCPHGQTLGTPNWWLQSPSVPPLRKVSADGTTIKGTYTAGPAVFTWDLHSEAQP